LPTKSAAAQFAYQVTESDTATNEKRFVAGEIAFLRRRNIGNFRSGASSQEISGVGLISLAPPTFVFTERFANSPIQPDASIAPIVIVWLSVSGNWLEEVNKNAPNQGRFSF